jgi:phospholipase C
MMENRSFDHLLGYLSLPPLQWPVDGVQSDEAWRTKASSMYNGNGYPPFPITDPPSHLLPADPPHEWYNIARQMGQPLNGIYPMNGFVENYASAKGAPPVGPTDSPPVMGYFSGEYIPMIDFFAKNFAVCDHWFSSLPAGTQPNRLMAMAGYSDIAVNQFPLPRQDLIYDWLTAHGVNWRVYHEDLPFFAMMLEWLPDILHGTHFRPFKEFFDDVQDEPPDEFPEVIFVEPTYTDAPHVGPGRDDHAPSAVQGGEEFLFEVYRDITLVPEIWEGTVMIVTYDEHGGFFDHISPPQITTDPPPGANYSRGFATLGIRVPAMIISPFVAAKSVFNGTLDHTSLLKFVAQKFDKGRSYSRGVDSRPVSSVLDVLNLVAARTDIPSAPTLGDYLAPAAGYIPGTLPPSPLGEGFKRALDDIRDHPANTNGKFDKLLKAFPAEPPIRAA